MMSSQETANRFWSKVNKTDSCWLWLGHLDKGGYGQFAYKRSSNCLAHRWAYQSLVGPIGDLPNGRPAPLDHLCRVRSCVNPAHLEIVTPRENLLRGVSAQALNAQKTHCVHGHAFTEANTYRYDHNRRRGCKTCRKMANARYRQKLQEV